ncbi:Sulphur transport [Salinihabitans flavidus]|uniref:Sulphur transport n=1 Tax=Salinihabitans flavidus TaxID=569882 RepID=A0A1H8PP19_9RHOB|nr:YeeE/YedE family protein [Salinihabitans flavidus]SEO43424.1 Sulphur transport [Salinihabitans flavidus]
MFESLGFDTLTASQAVVILALVVGVLFGVLAERSKFCFRRGLVGEYRRSALGVWLMALAVAVVGTQAAVHAGLITFGDHRFMSTDLPLLALVIGGGLFGIGMVLTRGCASRLTVLIGTGNLRALMSVVVFAIVAHAAMKGLLAPLRVAVTSVTVPIESAALPGPAVVWAIVIAAASLIYALRSGSRPGHLVIAAMIGALVPLAWVGTGFILYDDFDPIAMQGLSFTLPATETLFFGIASSAIPASFGTGLIAGVIGGALLSALLFGSFQWQSFETPGQTRRYLLGGALMGLGGVLAGGCTVGAGLSGVPTLSLAAVIALLSMAAAALLTQRVLNAAGRVSAAPSTRQSQQPAE